MCFKQLHPHQVKRRNYSPSQMRRAYDSVLKDKIAVERSANMYGVPITTLKDRVRGRISVDCLRPGPAPLLTVAQEKQLTEHLKASAQLGYGYRRKQVMAMASEYAVAIGIRKPGEHLGKKWFSKFMFRWPELKLIQPSNLDILRAKCVDEEVISRYYDELEKIIITYNFDQKPHLIYNIDEKGLSSNHKTPKIITVSDFKPQTVVPCRFNVTVIGCGSAGGMHIPPYFVFPGRKMNPDLLKNTTPGTDGTVSESGWSNTCIFNDYLQNHFMKYCQGSSEEYKLILYDGHKSHINPSLIQWAKSNKLILFVLPPHSSHILQPLDVGCFGPYQKFFANEVDSYMKSHPGQLVTKFTIADVGSHSYIKALSANNLMSSFKKTGIFPFSRTAYDISKLGPNKVWGKKNDEGTLSSQKKDVSFDDYLKVSTTSVQVGVTPSIEEPPKKQRRTISKIVAGKAITDDTVLEKNPFSQ